MQTFKGQFSLETNECYHCFMPAGCINTKRVCSCFDHINFSSWQHVPVYSFYSIAETICWPLRLRWSGEEITSFSVVTVPVVGQKRSLKILLDAMHRRGRFLCWWRKRSGAQWNWLMPNLFVCVFVQVTPSQKYWPSGRPGIPERHHFKRPYTHAHCAHIPSYTQTCTHSHRHTWTQNYSFFLVDFVVFL